MKAKVVILLLLGLVGAGGVLYYYEAQIKQLQNLTYELISITMPQVSTDQTMINLVLRIHSQSTLDAQVTGLAVDVYLAGKKVGTVSSPQPFVIPAKGYSDAALTIITSPALLLDNATSLLLNFSTQSDIAINLVGFVTIKEGFLTLSVPFTYGTTMKQILS